jgi:hypothetical protein
MQELYEIHHLNYYVLYIIYIYIYVCVCVGMYVYMYRCMYICIGELLQNSTIKGFVKT